MTASNERSTILHLQRNGVSVVIDIRGPGQPVVVHWGDDVGELSQDELVAMQLSAVPAVPNAVADVHAPRGLLPERAWGYRGRPGLSGHRGGGDFAPQLILAASAFSEQGDGSSAAEFTLVDDVAGLSVDSRWTLDEFGVLQVQQSITNIGSMAYQLGELAVVLPVPPLATEIMDFSGQWARERAPQRRPFSFGAWTRENRRGRTASDSAFLMIAGSAGFTNREGQVWAVHLGWSGDQATWAEAVPDGTRVIGAAELLAPGEIELAPSETYQAPTVFAVHSAAGLDGISDRFHQHLRARPHHPRSPRPAVLNTWEAVYFDHHLERLKQLADHGARVGIERFVLDDGWFGGRRGEKSSLGDWYVSPDVWPDGLHPLVSHVRGLGMEFGLWVEPEMINVDSDLYRAHPDWVLGPPGRLPPSARYQQVLDIANPDAFAYVFATLDGLVKEYGIDYLKWDHNRDLVNAVHDGRAGVHSQTIAVYRLIDELKGANPGLEIESCASGGARVDLGILSRTDRVWTSDCNDALERQHIQRWTRLLLPPELVGAHVGPPKAHTTGRTQSLSFRGATAIFGHTGVEWDIASATDEDRAALGRVLAIYHRLRPMLHTGTTVNVDHPDPAATVSGVVSSDRAAALFCYAQLTNGSTERPVAVRLAGLDPDRRYTVTVLEAGEPTPVLERKAPPWISAGSITLSGRVLETIGLAVPVLLPEQALLLELTS